MMDSETLLREIFYDKKSVQHGYARAIREIKAMVEDLQYIDNYGRDCCHVDDMQTRLDAMME